MKFGEKIDKGCEVQFMNDILILSFKYLKYFVCLLNKY